MRYLCRASLVGRPTSGRLVLRSGGGGLSEWWCARSMSLLPSPAPSAPAATGARVGRDFLAAFSTNRNVRDPASSRKTSDAKETAPLTGAHDKVGVIV